MTPAKQAKKAGLKSLAQVSEVSGVSTRTLTNWYKSNNWLFSAVIEKAKKQIDQQE